MPAPASDWAMAQAMERLLATPSTIPVLPSSSFMAALRRHDIRGGALSPPSAAGRPLKLGVLFNNPADPE
jgi:hypothetical protein